jgi:hypothetical protein
MFSVLAELARVVAYGGVGTIGGFIAGVWVNDRHRLVTTILDEAERDMPSGRSRRLSGNTLQTVTVVIVMVAMLLTGLTWMQTERVNNAQDRRDCETLSQLSEILRDRTKVYREAALPERRVWLDLRRNLLDLGAKQNDPIVLSINRYLTAQERYVEHLANNPYPTGVRKDCS